MRSALFLLTFSIVLALPLRAAEGLTNPFFAFDNGTGRDQKTPPEDQAELVKRTGYAGLGFSGAQGVPEMLKALESRGLRLFSIYVASRVDGENPGFDPALPEAMNRDLAYSSGEIPGWRGTRNEDCPRSRRYGGWFGFAGSSLSAHRFLCGAH
jgi:hypothetical protein